MNATTYSAFVNEAQSDQSTSIAGRHDTNEPHLVVQILSVIAFGVFSIVGISLAFATFWLAGLVLAALIAWTWAGSRTFGGRHSWPDPTKVRSINDLAPAVSAKRSSGNSSFDAYRAEMLQRLEQENRDFEDFLIRLRDASDAKEFDQFMDDRANVARESGPDGSVKEIAA